MSEERNAIPLIITGICSIIGITELGLVQMTRKRTRESLEQVLCEPCVCCQGLWLR